MENTYLSSNTIDNWYEKYIEWANNSVPDYVYNTSKYIPYSDISILVLYTTVLLGFHL